MITSGPVNKGDSGPKMWSWGLGASTIRTNGSRSRHTTGNAIRSAFSRNDSSGSGDFGINQARSRLNALSDNAGFLEAAIGGDFEISKGRYPATIYDNITLIIYVDCYIPVNPLSQSCHNLEAISNNFIGSCVKHTLRQFYRPHAIPFCLCHFATRRIGFIGCQRVFR